MAGAPKWQTQMNFQPTHPLQIENFIRLRLDYVLYIYYVYIYIYCIYIYTYMLTFVNKVVGCI